MIPVAVDEMLANAKVTLERRMAIQQYEEGFEVNLGEDWFNKMFIPAAVCKPRKRRSGEVIENY